MKKYAKLLVVPAAFLALGSYSATTTTLTLDDSYETITTTDLTAGSTYYFTDDAWVANPAAVANTTANKIKASNIKAEDGYVKCTAETTKKCKVTAVVLGDVADEDTYNVTFDDEDDYKVPYTLNVGKDKAVVIPDDFTLTLGTLTAGSGTTITVNGTLKGGIKTAGAEVDGVENVTGTVTYIVDAPTNVRIALGASDDSIVVAWDAVDEATGYQVLRATSKTGTYSAVATVEEDETSYEDESVAHSKTYYYKVKAIRDNAKSDLSEVSVVTGADPVEYGLALPIEAATTLTAKEDTYNTVKLTAKKVDGAEGYEFSRGINTYCTAEQVADAEVTRCNALTDVYSTAWTKLTTQSSNVYTAKSLKTGQEYVFKVRAYVTLNSKKVYSTETVSAVITPTLGKTTLTAAATTTTSKSTVKFTFKKVTGANGYCITTTDVPGFDFEPDTHCTTGTSLTLEDSDLGTPVVGTKYSFTAKAYRTIDGDKVYGEASKTVKAATKPVTPKVTTKGITNFTYDSQKVKVAIDDSVAAGNVVYIYRATSKTGTFKLVDNNVEVAAADVANGYVVVLSDELTAGNTYYYKARVKANDTYSEYSSVVGKELTVGDFTKNGDTAATTYIAVEINGAHSNKVTLQNMNNAAGFGIAGGIDGFQISRKITSSGTWKVVKTINVDADDETYEDVEYIHKGLTTGKTYYYRVRAFKTVNGKKVYGKYSTTVSSAPKAPAPETVYAEATDKSVKLTWDKVKNVTGYKIYRDDELIATTSKLTYTDSKVEEDESYEYTVKAYVKVKGSNKIGFASKVLEITVAEGNSESVETTLAESLAEED